MICVHLIHLDAVGRFSTLVVTPQSKSMCTPRKVELIDDFCARFPLLIHN